MESSRSVLRGLTFSITAGVGFITLFGVSVLNGVVLVSEINRLRESGRNIDEAIASASRDRLRPILMALAGGSLRLYSNGHFARRRG